MYRLVSGGIWHTLGHEPARHHHHDNLRRRLRLSSAQSPASVAWMRALLEEDGMRDTFTIAHPAALVRARRRRRLALLPLPAPPLLLERLSSSSRARTAGALHVLGAVHEQALRERGRAHRLHTGGAAPRLPSPCSHVSRSPARGRSARRIRGRFIFGARRRSTAPCSSRSAAAACSTRRCAPSATTARRTAHARDSSRRLRTGAGAPRPRRAAGSPRGAWRTTIARPATRHRAARLPAYVPACPPARLSVRLPACLRGCVRACVHASLPVHPPALRRGRCLGPLLLDLLSSLGARLTHARSSNRRGRGSSTRPRAAATTWPSRCCCHPRQRRRACARRSCARTSARARRSRTGSSAACSPCSSLGGHGRDGAGRGAGKTLLDSSAARILHKCCSYTTLVALV